MSKVKNMYCKQCGESITNKTKVCPKCGKKFRRHLGLKISLGFVTLFIAFIILIGFSSSKADVVKTGYLGNYRDAAIGKVMSANFTETKWDSFTAQGKNIVEVDCKSKNMSTKIQFIIKDNNTFEIGYMDINGLAFSNTEAKDAKDYINSLYYNYYKSLGNEIDVYDENVLRGSK